MENAPSMGNPFKEKVALCKLYVSKLKGLVHEPKVLDGEVR